MLDPVLDELRRSEADINDFIETVGRLLAREPVLENPDSVTAFERRAGELLAEAGSRLERP